MKRIVFTVAMLLIAVFSVQAQEKGSYLTVWGGLGSNQFRYEMDNNKMGTDRLGYSFGLGYQYFFNRHWGIGTGVGLDYYSEKAIYNNSWKNDPEHYQFNNLIDDQGTSYDMRVRINNWTEKQRAYVLDIPLMALYQTKWGAKQAIGMYMGLGVKAQLPVFGQEYVVKDGSELGVYGYYPQWNITFGHQTIDENKHNQIPGHGLGTVNKAGFKGDLDLKFSVAGTAELGFLIALGPRVDLTVGGYFDYGFLNVKKGNKSDEKYLIERTADYATSIGGNLEYNGIINSYATDDVKLFAFGGKLGLRIKLGKLSEKEESIKQTAEELIVVQEVVKEPEPVVEVKPVVVEEQKGISEADMAILSEPIFFDLAKSTLKHESIDVLNRKVTIMNKYPEVKIVILGNTCDLGGDRINIPLGQRRADAARDYLINNGINANRMSTVTQAASHPMVPNTNEENRSKNRRDDFNPKQ